MKRASWILLSVLGVAITFFSLVSAVHAYRTNDDYGIGDSRVSTVAGGDAGVATALRGIRGTSAAFGAAYGVLFLAIVLGPYRRGEVWAWNALLVAGLTQCASPSSAHSSASPRRLPRSLSWSWGSCSTSAACGARAAVEQPVEVHGASRFREWRQRPCCSGAPVPKAHPNRDEGGKRPGQRDGFSDVTRPRTYGRPGRAWRS
jgi:hypothetical protein